MRDRPIGVLVVDDQPDFPRAARTMLGLTDDFAVVGEARSVPEALAALARPGGPPVDLVLMDVNMEPVDGITGARQVLASAAATGATGPPVVVLCSTLGAGELPAIPADLDVSFLAKEALDPEALLAAYHRHHRR